MLRKLISSVVTFAAYTTAQETEPETETLTQEEINAKLACNVFGADDFTEYDLRPLEKKDGSIYKNLAFEWNFCSYLPGTEYFATQFELMEGVHILTSDNYIPDKVTVLKNEKGKPIGVGITRMEDGEHCEKTPGNFEPYGFTT